MAERQHGVVGRRQLNEIGIDNQVLRPILNRGSLISLSDQVLRVAGSERNPRQHAMAAVLDGPPGAVLSHRSAAALWGLPGFHLLAPFHITVPRQGTTRRAALCVVHFQKDMPVDEVVILDGIPVASPSLTMFHLAGVLHPAHAERTLDNGLARHLLSPRKYATVVQRLAAPGRNGSRVARQLAAARSDGYRPPESGLERRVEWCADRAGVAVERQVALGDHEFVGRVDFRLVGLNGILEAQSVVHHSTPLDRESDEARVARLLASGVSVLFVWDRQAFGLPQVVIREIRRFHAEVQTSPAPFFRECPDE